MHVVHVSPHSVLAGNKIVDYPPATTPNRYLLKYYGNRLDGGITARITSDPAIMQLQAVFQT